jgi:hypothetical protein
MTGFNHLEAPHVRALIAQGAVTTLPLELSRSFEQHLAAHYPLQPEQAVDWNLVSGSVRLRWVGIADERVYSFVKKTRLGPFEQVAVWYNGREACLACPLSFAVYNLDSLYLRASGAKFVFGLRMQPDGSYRGYFDDFVELFLGSSMWLSGVQGVRREIKSEI